MNLYMLYNAEINQNQISHLECEYEASSNMLNLCLGNITGILVVSNAIEIPEEKSSCAQDTIKFITPKYSESLEVHDEWLHFLFQEPLNKKFMEASSPKVCLCTIEESELANEYLKNLEMVFLSKMVILDAVSPQIERRLRANGWEIAKAYS